MASIGRSYMLTEERCKRLSKLSKMLNNAPVHLFSDSDDSGRKGFKTSKKRLQTLITPVIYHDILPVRNDGWDIADEIWKDLNTK
jgi:isopentenyl phosphate kinase